MAADAAAEQEPNVDVMLYSLPSPLLYVLSFSPPPFSPSIPDTLGCPRAYAWDDGRGNVGTCSRRGVGRGPLYIHFDFHCGLIPNWAIEPGGVKRVSFLQYDMRCAHVAVGTRRVYFKNAIFILWPGTIRRPPMAANYSARGEHAHHRHGCKHGQAVAFRTPAWPPPPRGSARPSA